MNSRSDRMGTERHQPPTSPQCSLQIHEIRQRGREVLLQLRMHRAGGGRYQAQQEFEKNAHGVPCHQGCGRGHG